ncbi:MAG: beta-lactamase family protein [Saprospiraceae bacterium]|nr:beta-lactamase family protein [Saprospiraceae bacterium]
MIGIIDHDSTYVYSFTDSNKLQLNDTSIYEIGGVSKIFTAHLCRLLQSEKKLDLTASILSYLPQVTNAQLKPVTIENLLTHTSGLINRPSNLGIKSTDPGDPYKNYTREDLITYLNGISFQRDTGDYLYSHLNYAVIEMILEQVTNSDFEDLLEQYIFLPNEMTHTFISNSSAKICPGYDRSGRLASPWSTNIFGASEGIKTNCADLLAYLHRQLLRGVEMTPLMEMLKPHKKIPNTKKAFAAEGWHLFKNKKDLTIYLHSGKTTGHAASVHFIPRTRTGVVLLTNAPGKMDGLATLVLRMLNQNWKRKS